LPVLRIDPEDAVDRSFYERQLPYAALEDGRHIGAEETPGDHEHHAERDDRPQEAPR
jgi:hypothetical protein